MKKMAIGVIITLLRFLLAEVSFATIFGRIALLVFGADYVIVSPSAEPDNRDI